MHKRDLWWMHQEHCFAWNCQHPYTGGIKATHSLAVLLCECFAALNVAVEAFCSFILKNVNFITVLRLHIWFYRALYKLAFWKPEILSPEPQSGTLQMTFNFFIYYPLPRLGIKSKLQNPLCWFATFFWTTNKNTSLTWGLKFHQPCWLPLSMN